jgi:hypothetical protein
MNEDQFTDECKIQNIIFRLMDQGLFITLPHEKLDGHIHMQSMCSPIKLSDSKTEACIEVPDLAAPQISK